MKEKRISGTRVLMLLFALFMAQTLVVPIYAVNPDGTLDYNLWWSINSNGTLSIGGNGPIGRYFSSWGDEDFGADIKRDGERKTPEEYEIELIAESYFAPWLNYGNQIGFQDTIRNIVIEDGVTSTGKGTFYSLKNVVSVSLPETLTKIGINSFIGCISLKHLTIPDSVTVVEKRALEDCTDLRNVHFGSGIKRIEEMAFMGCYNLTEVNFPYGLVSIGANAFNGSALTSVDLPDSISEIGTGAFVGQPITTLDIPNSLTQISQSAFSGCAKLRILKMHCNTTEIGRGAFNGCKCLTDIYYEGTEAQWKAIKIGDQNLPLLKATVHFTGEAEPSQEKTTANPSILLPSGEKVQRTIQKFTVDGVKEEAEIYNINGNNYFKLRDVASLLNGTNSQFSVDYNAVRGTIVVQTGKPYTPVGGELVIGMDRSASAIKSAQSIEIDGTKAELVAFNIGGSNFFKLRDLGTALGFAVDYDQSTATIEIRSTPKKEVGTSANGKANHAVVVKSDNLSISDISCTFIVGAGQRGQIYSGDPNFRGYIDIKYTVDGPSSVNGAFPVASTPTEWRDDQIRFTAGQMLGMMETDFSGNSVREMPPITLDACIPVFAGDVGADGKLYELIVGYTFGFKLVGTAVIQIDLTGAGI